MGPQDHAWHSRPPSHPSPVNCHDASSLTTLCVRQRFLDAVVPPGLPSYDQTRNTYNQRACVLTASHLALSLCPTYCASKTGVIIDTTVAPLRNLLAWPICNSLATTWQKTWSARAKQERGRGQHITSYPCDPCCNTNSIEDTNDIGVQELQIVQERKKVDEKRRIK